jgi:hypothetical protein
MHMKQLSLCFLALYIGCQTPHTSENSSPVVDLTSDFKTYWFDGTAEISSFALTQSRYGEPREGTAVLIYVTEDFLTDAQVKANQKSAQSKTVLKLNRTKNFVTGIYPYSIMNSSFTYLEETDPLAKITTSIQEWCGQVYLQLNKKNRLQIQSHSYFEGEADQQLTLKNGQTEDALWHLIRTNPTLLPQGPLEVLPAFEYIRLQHKPIKFYEATATLEDKETHAVYQLRYRELNRILTLSFEKEAPYQIIGWEERDTNNQEYTTRATKIKTVKLPYWKLNHLGEERFRDSLGLN